MYPASGLGRRVDGVGDGVADVDVVDVLDLGHEVADLPGGELVARRHAGAELAELDDVVLACRRASA